MNDLVRDSLAVVGIAAAAAAVCAVTVAHTFDVGAITATYTDEPICVTLPAGVTWPRLDYHPSGAWVLDGVIIGYSMHEDDSCIAAP